MVFSLEFGLAGLVLAIVLLLALPLLVGVITWQVMRIRELRGVIRQQARQLPPRPRPARSEEAYDHFVRTISHQLSNALQAILGACANLALTLAAVDETPPKAKAEEHLRQIDAETHRLMDLTAQLRLLAQLESENAPISVQSVQLRGVIADIIMQYGEQAMQQGIELLYHGPDHPPRILANRDQIRLVINNLVSNSLKYADEKSQQIVLGLSVQEETIQISVSDDGIGIPADFLPNVFDDAYRAPDAHIRRRSGAGLGLAIVRRIIERHQGKIEVYSQYGHGTTFSVSLPRRSELQIQ